MAQNREEAMATLMSMFPQYSSSTLRERLTAHGGDLQATVGGLIGGDDGQGEGNVVDGDEALARRLWEEEMRAADAQRAPGAGTNGGRGLGIGRGMGSGEEDGNRGWEGELWRWGEWVVGGAREMGKVVGETVGEAWRGLTGDGEGTTAAHNVEPRPDAVERRDGVVRGGGEMGAMEGVRRRNRRSENVASAGSRMKND